LTLILPDEGNTTLEKIGGAISNICSRDTGNIAHKTQNKDKQNKKTENKKDEQHGPTK